MEKNPYMWQENLRRQQACYKDTIREQVSAGRTIVLYGAGMYGRKILSLLRQSISMCTLLL